VDWGSLSGVEIGFLKKFHLCFALFEVSDTSTFALSEMEIYFYTQCSVAVNLEREFNPCIDKI
jgi:hypothetical protein